MTTPTHDLTRLLTDTADAIVERAPVPGPDTSGLWRRGRRATWLTRGAAAGLAVLLVITGSAIAAVVRSAAPAVPSEGGTLTYPELVTDLFTGSRTAGPQPVFGLVALPGEYNQPSAPGVVERTGALVSLPRWSTSSTGVYSSSLGNRGAALAPDGRHLLIPDGILDLTDGSIVHALRVEGVSQISIDGYSSWSPDSQHVAVNTHQGPAVLDRFADVALEPAATDTDVLIAGWRDDTTALGVRSPSANQGAALDIVTRALTDKDWTTVGTVGADAVKTDDAAGGQVTPTEVSASPDGSRLLIVDRGGRSVLVDARTGQRVAFSGAALALTAATWDSCGPVWQGNQPLLASGGLHRPGDGTTILRFADRVEAGCLVVAGNELTGTPAPGMAWREHVWSVALPAGWALVLIAAAWFTAWIVIALRRSRRQGEDFLPMVLRLPF